MKGIKFGISVNVTQKPVREIMCAGTVEAHTWVKIVDADLSLVIASRHFFSSGMLPTTSLAYNLISLAYKQPHFIGKQTVLRPSINK